MLSNLQRFAVQAAPKYEVPSQFKQINCSTFVGDIKKVLSDKKSILHNYSLQMSVAHSFYTPANEIRKTIKNIPIPAEHAIALKNIDWLISDMIELQIDRESSLLYQPLLEQHKDALKSGSTPREVEKRLTELCEQSNIHFGALIEAYIRIIQDPSQSAIIELQEFRGKYSGSNSQKTFRKAVMTNYFLYEMYTRVQSQLATLFQEMRRAYKKIRTARDLTEMVRFKVEAKELKPLLPIWSESHLTYRQVDAYEVIA